MQWGDDSDTLGAIVGSLAEAYYGIPSQMADYAMTYLPDSMKNIITEFKNKYQEYGNDF